MKTYTYKFVAAQNYISPNGSVVAVVDFEVNGRPRYYKAHHQYTRPVDLKNTLEQVVHNRHTIADLGDGGNLTDYGWKVQ